MTSPPRPRAARILPRLVVLASCLLGNGMPSLAGAGMSLPHADGYWASPAPPPQWQHAAVHVPEHDLLVAVVPVPPSGTEIWALPLADADAWIRLATGGPNFGPGLVAVHDPVGRRIVVHGGEGGTAATWALALEPDVRWVELVSAGAGPAPRRDHAAVYDARKERVLLFGGRGGGQLLGDAWELRLRTGGPLRWSPLATRGVGPGARAGHAAVYDSAASRVLVFGGGEVDEGADGWELALHGNGVGHWRRIAPSSGPAASRSDHTWVRDPASGALLLHGGVDASGVPQNDTWTLRLDGAPAWTRLAPGGPTPPPRAGHIALFDPARGRMIVSGGLPSPGGRNETWSLTLLATPQWARLAPMPDLPPADEWGYRGAIDTVRGRLVVLHSGQTWILDFGPNPRASRVFDAPVTRADFYYDPARDRIVVHGGLGPQGRSNTTWELRMDEGLVLGYRPLATTGDPPGRYDHVVVHDTRRDRMAIFGGIAHPVGTCAISVDTYVLAMSEPSLPWSAVPATAFPEGGWFAVGAYDESGDRLIVHGGLFGCRFPTHPSGESFDGTWSVDLGDPRAWVRLVPPGGGPVNGAADAVYDGPGRRMLVPRSPTIWSFGLEPGAEAWHPLAPRGEAPQFNSRSSFDHDPQRDRFVLVTSAGQVRYFVPSRGPAPVPVAAARAMASPARTTDARSAGLSLDVPNHPARGGVVSLAVAVPGRTPARLELLDVRGRLVAARTVAAGALREETWSLPGRPAGIYFARLRQGAHARVAKVVFVP